MVLETPIDELVQLSRWLGSPDRGLSILAEGNASTALDAETFWVKASGTQMGNATSGSFVEVRFAPILEALAISDQSDSQTRSLLTDARVEGQTMMPSVETFMHAYLLSLPDVNFVGHTHPVALLPILCLEDAREIAKLRLFPDDVVCCGPESAFVPYVDPGLPLARAIRESVEGYVNRWGAIPKTIWLENHGLIAIGRSVAEIQSATLMSAKSAQVWMGAISSQRKIKPLTPDQVERIHTRPDEHYRQRLLWQIQQEQKI